MRDDAAAPPKSLRINYYVIFFVLAILIAVPAASAGMAIRDYFFRQESGRDIENRLVLLYALKLATGEKRRLLEQAGDQIESYQKTEDASQVTALRELRETLLLSIPEPFDPRADAVSRDAAELRHIRMGSEILLDTLGYGALHTIWNRFDLHGNMPRGRPLRPGIGSITSVFGNRIDPFSQTPGKPDPAIITDTGDFHNGLDFAAAPETPILATGPGIVVRAVEEDKEGYGLHVRIHHGLGYTSLYAHCSKILVKKGDVVKRGQQIATVGRTGRATGHHVHYEIQLGNNPTIDPMQFVQLK